MMGLNLVVLVKQVPDTQNITGDAMKEDGTVNRGALDAIFNPEDLYALEAALRVKEEVAGSKVHVLTMGPPTAEQVLKDSLYRGADTVALITDRKFAGADTLATSYALKCAIEKIDKYDIVFCGRQAIDGDTAQVGPQTAEKLGINQITCVSQIEQIDTDSLIARRSIEGGYEIVKSAYPVLVTMTDEGHSPRTSSAIRVMTYKNTKAGDKEIPLWDIDFIGADVEACGLKGSPTKVKAIESVVLTSEDLQMIENTDEGIHGLMHTLITDHTLG
jgi:electron transfer flavoprotein beta subunit